VRLQKAPLGLEAVARIDVLFAIEREINGAEPTERRRVRQERSKPLVDELGIWLREQYARVSPASKIGKAIAYSLNLWDALVRFLDDGRLCISNNAAERAMRPVATGRRNWTFAGSDEGGRRAAAIYSLIETAKINDIESASTSCSPGTGRRHCTNAPLPERLSYLHAAAITCAAALTGRVRCGSTYA
jgi:transposase